jgi:hypothetical protein
MRWHLSTEARLFLTVWLVYSVHFATNITREHYPAFSLIAHGTFQLDEYAGFHSDIFQHQDGHWYINNNVATSVVAAVPLLVFNPALDALEARSKSRLAQSDGPPDTTYRTKYPLRRRFFRLVKERGLDLRFGGAAFATSIFFMAPLSSLFVVLMFRILRQRGVTNNRALWLALLFAFATPVFFRTAHLNHNMFVMYVTFAAFDLLWVRPEQKFPLSLGHRIGSGFLAGLSLAFDYSGVISLLALYGYLWIVRLSTASWLRSGVESIGFVAGSMPAVGFLLWSQWVMFGNPFLPAQYWMPRVNYTDTGWRGFDWPAVDLFMRNLFDPAYGMFVFAPILLVGLIPARWYPAETLLVPRREGRFVLIYSVLFLAFCASNQYARMQWNTGFRMLLPIVPFVYLAASEHLARLPPNWLAALSVPCVLHCWVLSMVRDDAVESWRRVVSEGIQLPWLTVLRQTSRVETWLLEGPLLPIVILAVCGLMIVGIWCIGKARDRREDRRLPAHNAKFDRLVREASSQELS